MKKHTLCAGGPGLLHVSQICVTENNLIAVFTAWCLGQNWAERAGSCVRGLSHVNLASHWLNRSILLSYWSLAGPEQPSRTVSYKQDLFNY